VIRKQLTIGRYALDLFLPDAPCRGMIYIPSHGGAQEIADLLPQHSAALVFVGGFDWNRDLSPWPAKAVFGGEDFAGGADAFLDELVSRIPEIERETGIRPLWRGIAGYSLAGLFAIYAVYRSGLFARAASVSGSMWFDGWMEYAQSRPFASRMERAYFSVGAKEKKTRNIRMQPVEENPRAMCSLFEARGVESRFVLNSGNHFVDAEKRLADALEYLLRE